MDVRTVSYVSGGVEQAMELSHLQTKQAGGRSERSISGSEPSKQPSATGGPNLYAPSVVSSQLRPQPVATVPTPAPVPVPVPVSIPPARSSQPPQQVRFTSEPRAEVKFAPAAPLKTPLVRPLLPAQQPQLQQHPRDLAAPAAIHPAPITLRQPIVLQQAPYAMDPVRPNPGMPPGAQMMRPPVNVGPPRTGTPTQPQPPRPGGMYTGPHQPPGVPMPMRPQMPPGAGVPGMQPGMQPRPPSAQGMQRPPMMGQPPPIRPPNPMGGPRPTISPQNSNLGGGMLPGMGGPRPPMPMPGGGGVGGPAGPPQGMRPNFYNRPMGPGDPSRPPSGIDMGGPGGGIAGGPPSSATPSVDDDEDVVIGRVPADSSSALNSPNPARAPSRNFNMPGPPSATGVEREKSIPSRPPSVAGNYGKPGSNEFELDSASGRPLHALKDFINKDPSRPGQSPTQSPSPGSQQSLSPANTDENFSYRPGPKPASGQPQYKLQPSPGTRPNAQSPSATGPGGRPEGDKVTFQIPNGGAREGSQEWNSRSRPPQQHMVRTGPKSLTADHKGDNDSGVDEYTQEKDRPNALASPASPLKSPSKIPGLARRPENISSETRSRSTSKQRANAKTPETPSEQPLIKKVPMNKIQVGGTPSPNLKVVKSKIGSLENASHKPGGGHVKIETKKVDIKAAPRIEAKNDAYVPKGGDKKIISTKLQWNAKPKIGSMDNASHKPGGGDKRIESIKTDFKERAKPKIGSKDNITYKPGGGDIKIVHQKLDIKAESKIGSLDNLKHKPGGGDKKIFDDKEYLKNIEHPITPSPSTQRSSSMRRMTASVSGVDLCRSIDYEPVRAPPLATASLTASLSIPSECIVLSVANEPSPERKVQKLESAPCFIRKDGRAIHPKPFRTY